MSAELKRYTRTSVFWALSFGLLLSSETGLCQGPENTSMGTEAESAVEQIRLAVGEQFVLSADGVRSYSEGTRGVVDVRLTQKGDQFVLVGQERGTTTLLLIMLDGKERHLAISVEDPQAEAKVQSGPEVEKQDNVRLDFYFVQLDRANSHQMGVGYPGSVSGGSLNAEFDFMSQSFQSATAVVQDQALLRLDMAQASGWAKLMRKAAVITENGKRAEFEGGGEVNIPVQGSLTTGIHSIDFGSRIEVLPRYDSRSGRLQIELAADVSDLTDDRGSGAPGRVTASLSTIVNLELGQAVVLAGLTSESKMKSKTGVPFLSQIPILGALFGSQRMQHQAVDNVIFIVPTVIEATTRDAREDIALALQAYQDYSGGASDRKKVQSTWEANHEQ